MAIPDEPQPDQLLDHNYDGIQEYDNPLPRWWVYLFWATIVLVPVYYLVPGTIGHGGTKERMYADALADFRKAHPAPAPGGGPSDEQLLALAKDAGRVGAGKAVYATNCAACHGPLGGGVIGPNLTDDAWLHGERPTEVHATVANGVLAKGMPAWGKQLTPDDVDAVVAYVLSLRGTAPPGAKAPEGAVRN